jgi:ferrochelatase
MMRIIGGIESAPSDWPLPPHPAPHHKSHTVNSPAPYDAVLFVSFGGPEGPDDVMPFLENVLRGRPVPRERMLEVAEHYQHFGGVSPINQQTRDLISAVETDLRANGLQIPIYWGNRNWHPMLTDTMTHMVKDGVKSAIAFVVSGYSSYSGCRQYRENILASQSTCGEQAPRVDKIRVFYNHPDFIEANADRMRAALQQIPAEARSQVHVAFTAHSIPESMASGCNYQQQLTETCRLVSEAVAVDADRWKLVYQSRSGRPQDPWLDPDICDHIQTLHGQGVKHLIVMPIGFLSDHIEVLYDLDDEAAKAAAGCGMQMVRAATVGTHPRFITMIRKLIMERMSPDFPKEAIGQYGPNWDVCPIDCCPAPQRPPAAGRPAAT